MNLAEDSKGNISGDGADSNNGSFTISNSGELETPLDLATN